MNRIRAWRRRAEIDSRVRWFWYAVGVIVLVCGLAAITVGVLKILLGLP